MTRLHSAQAFALVLLAAARWMIPASAQAVEPGVSKALATNRAERVADVRYKLDLTLTPHAAAIRAHETLTFTLRPNQAVSDLPLDFRDGTLVAARLNDTAIPTALTNGHLVLPSSQLHIGVNTAELQFTSRVATAGAAITRYEDKEDNSEYLYSLFVPMDASMAFPCFDQPDLKARFTLNVQAPPTWTVISNTQGSSQPSASQTSWSFPETKPISTYLFAFAAGPWARFPGQPGEPAVYVRRSQQQRAAPELPQLQHITAQGMTWLADFFQQPFPFPKYDIVLIPGFPFGGMEHAGATFLREDGVLFRAAPTANDRFNRNILTLHELTHQWFGDLVTMRWFDDLWLKEGFAQYMAYHALDTLDPASQPWKHFYEGIKPQAYGIDETLGTTPIFQNIPNLRDAKSAYGAIVYQKAPAILKQLEFRLGPDNFRNGLRLYLAQHAYSNAQWSDLINAFHTASNQDVRSWADAWVLRRGMPEISTSFSCDAQNRITELKLEQHDVLPDNYVWPISNEVLLGGVGTFRISWNTARTTVEQAMGRPCPAFIFANANDQAYGRFLLDQTSELAVRNILIADTAPASFQEHSIRVHAPGEPGTISAKVTASAFLPAPLLRSMLWGALWDNVHVARSAPRGYVELALKNLPTEDDETLASIQGGHTITALHFYMTDKGRSAFVPQLEQTATHRMLTASTVGLRIVSFRTLTGVAETPTARATLKDLLAAKTTIPGVDLRPLDRWGLVGKLISLNDPDAPALFTVETQRDHTDDGQKYAWAVQAGLPDPTTKQRYFAQYLTPPSAPDSKPEDWLNQSLRPFNTWNQSALTEPYLRRALDQLPEIKRDRKIFYLGSWLSSFFDGQITPSAEQTVQTWLTQPNIDPDLRLKVLENNDDLQRTVRIRQKFPD